MNIENIADRACSYGMRRDIGDGMNVLDVYQRAKTALEIARSGEGPTLLELKTFRFCGHSRRDPNNYMPAEEKDFWKNRDPVILFEKFLIKQGILDNAIIAQIRKTIEDKIEEAVQFGRQSPETALEDTYNDLYINMEVPR